MWELLEHLRAKPRAVRQRIVVGVSGALSLLVFASWWGGLTANEHMEPVADTGKSPIAVVGTTLKNLTTHSQSLWHDTMTKLEYDAQTQVAGAAAANDTSASIPTKEEGATTESIETVPVVETTARAETPIREATDPDMVFPDGTDSSFIPQTQASTTSN